MCCLTLQVLWHIRLLTRSLLCGLNTFKCRWISPLVNMFASQKLAQAQYMLQMSSCKSFGGLVDSKIWRSSPLRFLSVELPILGARCAYIYIDIDIDMMIYVFFLLGLHYHDALHFVSAGAVLCRYAAFLWKTISVLKAARVTAVVFFHAFMWHVPQLASLSHLYSIYIFSHPHTHIYIYNYIYIYTYIYIYILHICDSSVNTDPFDTFLYATRYGIPCALYRALPHGVYEASRWARLLSEVSHGRPIVWHHNVKKNRRYPHWTNSF